MRAWLLRIRKLVINSVSRLLFLFGRRPLGRDETLRLLHDADALDHGCISLSPTIRTIELLKFGVVRINKKFCLDLDYGASSAVVGWLGKCTEHENILAVWSHSWMGYYHWLIDIAPKIALHRDMIAAGELTLAYPRGVSPYENEVLGLLGIDPCRVLDTRQFRLIRARRLHFEILPGWYEIQSGALVLREMILQAVPKVPGAKKIYLTRGGRRRCVNEQQLAAFLHERGFVIIEDIQRTVVEQVEIFSSASMIVALHGAALSNLLWCAPGTHVVECFSASYRPAYYRNLSQMVGLDYHACPETVQQPDGWENVNEDIEVNLADLEAILAKLGRNPDTVNV